MKDKNVNKKIAINKLVKTMKIWKNQYNAKIIKKKEWFKFLLKDHNVNSKIAINKLVKTMKIWKKQCIVKIIKKKEWF